MLHPSAYSTNSGKKNSILTGFYLCLLLCGFQVQAQQEDTKGQETQQLELSRISADNNHVAGQIPVFYNKESARGNPFLANNWLHGVLELADHKRIPEPGYNLYFNYDKFKNQLVITFDGMNIWSYPNDSISSFVLIDSTTTWSFEKVSWISRSFFLQPVLRSEKGYSLYKRVITKFINADYKNNVYWTTGKKYDEYVDYYEYYLVCQGNKSYKKFFLKEAAVRSALKPESAGLTSFFSGKNSPLDERTLVSLVQYINDRKDR
ncbi:MAG TPA: hypothetical protein VK563_21705 [Puia sp.]|nr:hypothetical protein [Puia sp.]